MERNSRFGVRDTRRLLRALGDLAAQPIDEVGTSHIERWKLQRANQVRPATVKRELNALSAALSRAQSWQLLTENPARRVRHRTEQPDNRTRVLSDVERNRLMNRLNLRGDGLAVMVITALNTGLGRAELFRLRWKDVYFGMMPALEVRSGRGQHRRSRRVPLNAVATNALQGWSRDRAHRGTLVFPGPKGGPLKNISAAWAELMQQSQIRAFRFSDCRHDFAARLAASGAPLNTIRDLLGLSTLNLVERYAVFAPGTNEAAVERLA
jgi:integrase